jgi:polyhydroxyalkanoate synthesis regulator phasin
VVASADAFARLLRAGSEAAETVAGAVERVGGTRVADSLRRAARPETLGKTLAPITRRLEDARQDVEKIVGGLVEKGRLSWEEGTRLREDVGLVFRESLADLVGSVRDIAGRLSPSTQPELAKEIGDLKTRLAQLESLAKSTFPAESRKLQRARRVTPAPAPPVKKSVRKQNRKRRTA